MDYTHTHVPRAVNEIVDHRRVVIYRFLRI